MNDDRITLLLEPKELDYVFNVLAQRPWGEVHALQANLQQQVQTHASTRASSNGHDKSEALAVQ